MEEAGGAVSIDSSKGTYNDQVPYDLLDQCVDWPMPSKSIRCERWTHRSAYRSALFSPEKVTRQRSFSPQREHTLPQSIMYLTLAMVMDVSATFVAMTQRRVPSGGDSKT